MPRFECRLIVSALSVVAVACGGDGSQQADTTRRVEWYAEASPYGRLVLEVDAVDGFEPSEATTEWLTGKLDEVTDKPDGVEVVRDETLERRGSDRVWTSRELDGLAERTSNLSTNDNTVEMHVLFVDGRYEEDTDDRRTLGLAWSHRNVVIFGEALREACELPNLPRLSDRLCQYTEQSIWLHEVGHVLGLVAIGAPLTADHHDTEHGAHCTNEDCVMYWEYEGARMVDVLRSRMSDSEPSTLNFDADCRADLEAIGAD